MIVIVLLILIVKNINIKKSRNSIFTCISSIISMTGMGFELISFIHWFILNDEYYKYNMPKIKTNFTITIKFIIFNIVNYFIMVWFHVHLEQNISNYSISNQEILFKYPNEHQSKSDKCISTDSSFVNRLYVIMLYQVNHLTYHKKMSLLLLLLLF